MSELKVNRATVIEWLDANEIEVTHTQLAGLFSSAIEAAQAQVVPAPGVEAVSEREFKQFLSDVLTAAGLVTHGNKCKDLGRRLGEMSMRLLTAPKTAAAPAQAASVDAERLDYLQECGATVEVLPGRPGWTFRIGGLHGTVHRSVRAAIDAARAAQKETND